MAKILSKGESVYECDVCKRRVRVPTNRVGLDVIQRCTITANCRGKLHRVLLSKDINETPAFPPEVVGVQDWFQRRVLYTHEQPVQSATWRVNHELANKPNVYVYVQRYVNGVETNVETNNFTIRVVDKDTLELVFDQAEQGLVQCITSASQNSTNPNTSAGITADTSDIVITVTGELTIATLDDSTTVDMQWTFNSPSSSTPQSIGYVGINAPSYKSPWASASTVVINGRQYVVRSFNIVTSGPAPLYFGTGLVSSGSTMAITTKPAAGEFLILLSTPPHGSVDRTMNKYIDVSTLSSPKLYYNLGEVYAPTSVIKNTYPPIIVD